MAELFTHVLAGFIIATIASWRHAWITPPLVVACMVGAAIPDLNRLDLLVPADTITAPTFSNLRSRAAARFLAEAHHALAEPVSILSTSAT